jgi:hypothetical protein
VTRFLPATRKLAIGAVAVILVLVASAFTGVELDGSHSVQVFNSVDRALCPFPLDVTVRGNDQATAALGLWLIGPSTITLRDALTGRTAVIEAPGAYSVDPANGSVSFSGRRVWFSATGAHVPFLSTSGRGKLVAPLFLLSAAGARARVIDPCALVSASPPSTTPVATPAPWGLPTDALSQIGYAGLTPVLGALIRHDHVHLDVLVNGHTVTVPAGVGQAEPVDDGPCPPGPLFGDCATHHFFTAKVAYSPLHTHSTSGIIHIESDRGGTFTLGEFFDEWGVRLDSSCIGGYCAGHGKELRVYVDGKRAAGDPRGVVLTNHQEIAVVFGSPGDFEDVPSSYTGGWPGAGCGGVGEHSCLP